MSERRLEWRIGVFMLVALALMAGLLLLFSKGVSVLPGGNYRIVLTTSNVGGIVPEANVLMAGVKVGQVERIELSDDGKTARLIITIRSNYQIHSDARFNIDSMGFLGDAYVSVTPGDNAGPILKDGDTHACQEPFNMQEVARATVGFIHRIDITAQKLNDAMTRLDKTLLSDDSLSNAAVAVLTFRRVSDHALTAVDDIHNLFATNSAPAAEAVSNLVVFSANINAVANQLNDLIATNRPELAEVIRNFQSASSTVRDIADGVQSGHGVIGGLIKDEKMRKELYEAIYRINSIGTNLDLFTARMNTNGLWSVLWKQKAPQKKSPPATQPAAAPSNN
jgi:ABC-type transporter Mla subunit MlaD